MTPTPDQHPQPAPVGAASRAAPPPSSARGAYQPTHRELHAHPAVRNYTLLCLAALFLLVVYLADSGLGWWSLLPALIGGLALLALWNSGPPLVLLSLAGLILANIRHSWRYPYWARDKVPTMMDLVLCAALLAYVVGHYRLLSLMHHVFPSDARRLPGSGFADPTRRRSADLVGAREIARLLVALPLWTCLSVVVWSWMMEEEIPLGMPREIWQTLRLIWAGLAVVAVTGVVAGYLRQNLETPQESLLYLQDQLWRQTRREQGSLNRWLAWARLRARRGRERS